MTDMARHSEYVLGMMLPRIEGKRGNQNAGYDGKEINKVKSKERYTDRKDHDPRKGKKQQNNQYGLQRYVRPIG